MAEREDPKTALDFLRSEKRRIERCANSLEGQIKQLRQDVEGAEADWRALHVQRDEIDSAICVLAEKA